jgi:hypothetical protein
MNKEATFNAVATDILTSKRLVPSLSNAFKAPVDEVRTFVFKKSAPVIAKTPSSSVSETETHALMIFDNLDEVASEAIIPSIQQLQTSNVTLLLATKYPAPVQSSCNIAVDYRQGSRQEFSQQDDFNQNLLRAIELETLEDGYSHPAERIIEDALKRYRSIAVAWIQSIYLKNIKRGTVCAGLLRCIGRLKRDLTKTWGLVMAISGLSHPNMEVREAAVRALEMWGGQEALETLKAYVSIEDVAWLKNYIEQVIQDLSE